MIPRVTSHCALKSTTGHFESEWVEIIAQPDTKKAISEAVRYRANLLLVSYLWSDSNNLTQTNVQIKASINSSNAFDHNVHCTMEEW